MTPDCKLNIQLQHKFQFFLAIIQILLILSHLRHKSAGDASPLLNSSLQ